MKYQLAYIFDTETEVIAARDLVDTAMGLPIAGGVTEHWTGYTAHGSKWVIMYAPELGPILGQPQVLPDWTEEEDLERLSETEEDL
jgi:hypothetical protein